MNNYFRQSKYKLLFLNWQMRSHIVILITHIVKLENIIICLFEEKLFLDIQFCKTYVKDASHPLHLWISFRIKNPLYVNLVDLLFGVCRRSELF